MHFHPKRYRERKLFRAWYILKKSTSIDKSLYSWKARSIKTELFPLLHTLTASTSRVTSCRRGTHRNSYNRHRTSRSFCVCAYARRNWPPRRQRCPRKLWSTRFPTKSYEYSFPTPAQQHFADGRPKIKLTIAPTAVSRCGRTIQTNTGFEKGTGKEPF